MPARRRSLREYEAKRDFSKTPEPGAVPARPTKRKARAPMFCVQKHLATRLHYDFRLEHNGTLLSWAVPKGPSLNPADKRLALQVEDHPIDYADFEGVIPEGYGMGIVMVWDKGTWKPLVDDVDAALAKGNLKFELDGVKLKGEWAMVRTGGGEGKSWLLIKKRDYWSGDVDIATLAPKSVKSRGDFEDILRKDKPEIWKSHKSSAGAVGGSRAAKTILDRLVKLKGKDAAPSPPKKTESKTTRKSKTRKESHFDL